MAEEGGINLQALSFDQLNQLKQSIEEVHTVLRTRRAPPLRSRRRTRPPTPQRFDLGCAGDARVAGCALAPQGLGGQAEHLKEVVGGAREDARGCATDTRRAALSAVHRVHDPDHLLAGTRMLVPITSSLYVPGETAPLDTVLIDVGTGYYIEKSLPEYLVGGLEPWTGISTHALRPEPCPTLLLQQGAGVPRPQDQSDHGAGDEGGAGDADQAAGAAGDRAGDEQQDHGGEASGGRGRELAHKQ